MEALLATFKALKVWQVGVLAAVLVGTAGATYGVYALTTRTDGVELSEEQQLIPVQYGDLVNQVSTNGSLLFPDREMLTFGSQGTVSELLVAEGDQVAEGQPLARLDPATVASLERTVAQSRVALRNAKEALADATAPPSPLDMAQAEADVANMRLSLKSAQEALEAVADTSTLENIAKAEIELKLAALVLTSARRELSQAQAGTALPGKVKLADAQKTFDTALTAYKDVFRGWLGIALGPEEAAQDPESLLAAWGVNLDLLFAREARYEAISIFSEAYVSGGLLGDDPATPWDEQIIYARLNFFPGTIRPTCGDDRLRSEEICIQREMDDAWTAYQNAQESLETVEAQAAKAVATTERSVAQSEENLAAAQETLADLMDGPEALDVEAKEKQLAVVGAKLVVAQEALSELLAGPEPLDVALREAEVASAQANLEEAMERLARADLLAPMAGVVSLVNVEVGQSVNPNTPIVEIVDPTVVEVDGIVDEIDVLFVREGAQAAVTMDALPGEVLEGTVSSIAAAGQNQQGVVSYPIRIRVQVPQGIQLREGLSATASIIIREESNVLLVPLQALYGSFEQPVVRVLSGGSIQERPVILGASDDFWVAVRDGLAEGDRVVMEATQASTSQLGFGATFRQLGGFSQSRDRGSRGSRGGGGGQRQR
jgi:HlyD family secretion protein